MQTTKNSPFLQRGKLSIILDGQFGSTGKGLISAFLAHRDYKSHNEFADLAISNAGPNAGHTAYVKGKKIVTFHMPMFGAVDWKKLIDGYNEDRTPIYLCAGSIIDPELFSEEIVRLGIPTDDIYIHPRATIVLPIHRNMEKIPGSSTAKLASTQKGTGAALADKILRVNGAVAEQNDRLKKFVAREDMTNWCRNNNGRLVIEVPQGASLGINHGLSYPYCTSREVSVAQALSDVSLNPRFLGSVMLSIRTLPIRVGNLYDEEQNVVGWSGPCYGDQEELKWDELGIEPETTTVTGRPRRIFSWSDIQFIDAIKTNRPTHLFINFMNYLLPEGQVTLANRINKICIDELGYIPHTWYGYGPKLEDVHSEVQQ